MNKYLMLLLLGVISSESQAQSLFPLAKGNVLYYTYSCLWCQQPSPSPTRTISVIGDSIMPNGKQYWILNSNAFFGAQYIRSDSNYIYYWYQQYPDSIWFEKRVFNYHANQGDIDTISFSSFMVATANGSHSSTLLGKPTITHGYALGGLIFGSISVADGFGYTNYEYRGDETPPFDNWTLTGCVLSDTIYGNPSSVHIAQELPTQIELFQNYPNPFNGYTTFQYSVSKSDHIRFSITTLLGQSIAVLVDQVQAPGRYTVHYLAENLSSGIYFCKLTTSVASKSIRFLYLK